MLQTLNQLRPQPDHVLLLVQYRDLVKHLLILLLVIHELLPVLVIHLLVGVDPFQQLHLFTVRAPVPLLLFYLAQVVLGLLPRLPIYFFAHQEALALLF